MHALQSGGVDERRHIDADLCALVGNSLQALLVRNLRDSPRQIRHRLGEIEPAQIVAESGVLVRAADTIGVGVDARRIDAAVDAPPESIRDRELILDAEMYQIVRHRIAVRWK